MTRTSVLARVRKRSEGPGPDSEGRRSQLAFAVGVALGLSLSDIALARGFPNKAVHVIVPFAPGAQAPVVGSAPSDSNRCRA